jgi:hypothetical protein
MIRKSTREITFSDKARRSKVATHKKHMPIVRCLCGSKILVLPDLKAMNLAINKHVAEHKKVHDASERLTAFLTEQVLLVACKNQA